MKIFPAILIISCTVSLSYSQQTGIDYNRLATGSEYKVLLTNGWETEGMLLKVDSNSVVIKTELKTFRINKADIDQIVSAGNEFSKTEYDTDNSFQFEGRKFYFAGTGIKFASTYENNSFSSGINFQGGIGRTFSNSSGIRGVFQYSKNPRIHDYSYYSSNYEGGDINIYSVTVDYMFGNLRSTDDFNIYGIAGGGIAVDHFTKMKYSNGNEYSYEYKGQTIKKINIETGAGFAYRVSNKAQICTEIGYEFPVLYLESNSYFNPFSSVQYGHLSLKAGMIMDF
ncbi:MAG: hypothetical protein JSS91_14105 [Bacteroidetes bacterium]|nr:hypothetical protein [Bacteroidota bacterium]